MSTNTILQNEVNMIKLKIGGICNIQTEDKIETFFKIFESQKQKELENFKENIKKEFGLKN